MERPRYKIRGTCLERDAFLTTPWSQNQTSESTSTDRKVLPKQKAHQHCEAAASKGTETLGREQQFFSSSTVDACKGQEVKSRERESGDIKRISELMPLESRGTGYLGGQRDFIGEDPKSCRWKAAAVPQQRLKQVMLWMRYAPSS